MITEKWKWQQVRTGNNYSKYKQKNIAKRRKFRGTESIASVLAYSRIAEKSESLMLRLQPAALAVAKVAWFRLDLGYKVTSQNKAVEIEDSTDIQTQAWYSTIEKKAKQFYSM